MDAKAYHFRLVCQVRRPTTEAVLQRDAVFSRSSPQKRHRRRVMCDVGIQKLKHVKCNPRITCICIFPPIIRDLIFRECFGVLHALKHGTEFRMGHTHHVYSYDISVCPFIENAASYCFIGRRAMVIKILNVTHLICGEKQKWHLQLLWMTFSSACDKSRIVALQERTIANCFGTPIAEVKQSRESRSEVSRLAGSSGCAACLARADHVNTTDRPFL